MCRLEANEVTTGNLSVLVPDAAARRAEAAWGAEACGAGRTLRAPPLAMRRKTGAPTVWRICEKLYAP